MTNTPPWEEDPIKIYKAKSLRLWLQISLTTQIRVVLLFQKEKHAQEFQEWSGRRNPAANVRFNLSSPGTKGQLEVQGAPEGAEWICQLSELTFDFSQESENRATWKAELQIQRNSKVPPEWRGEMTFSEWTRRKSAHDLVSHATQTRRLAAGPQKHSKVMEGTRVFPQAWWWLKNASIWAVPERKIRLPRRSLCI